MTVSVTVLVLLVVVPVTTVCKKSLESFKFQTDNCFHEEQFNLKNDALEK